MTGDQLGVLVLTGVCMLALVAAAILLLRWGGSEHEISRRIRKLHEGATMERPEPARFVPAATSLLRTLGMAMRDKMMSARDAEILAKTLAASGLEPSKTMPIFLGAKFACLFLLPSAAYLCSVLFEYSIGKLVLVVFASLVVAMLLPNWVVALIRRPYQAALRRGIPDALDLMVVCSEAGLGLDSAVERVAQEMRKSNRPVGVEFSLLMHEMRIYPDRKIALANLAERTGLPALKRLASTIAQTLKYGTPLGQGLRTLAAEMRHDRVIQFEEKAGRLPALLMMPMILFILPCLFIIIMGDLQSGLWVCSE
jgi:tight adherence protein C